MAGRLLWVGTLLLAGAVCLGNGASHARGMDYVQEHVIAPGSDVSAARFAEVGASINGPAAGASPGAVPAGSASGNVKINKDLKVAGSVLTRGLAVRNLTVTGKMSVGTTLTANKVSATLLSSDVVETGTLAAKAGDTIIVDGDFELTGDANGASASEGSSEGMSFLATNVVVNGVRQWHLVHFDDFEHNELRSDDASAAEGWSLTHRSSCGDGATADHFLGGHCSLGGDASASKRYGDLPPHSSLRVRATFHFLDKWEGETGFLKIDGQYTWADMADTSGMHPTRSLNVCGGDHPDAKVGIPIDITVPHSKGTVHLDFGARLAGKDACDASFGIDNVMVYVR